MVDYDPLPAVLSAEEALKDDVAALPGARVERRESRRLGGARRRAVRRLRPRRLGRDREPAAGSRAARAALGGSAGRRRRPADALGHLADAAHGQDGGRRAARARPGAGARRQPGRRRRVRREDARARRRARRVARAQARDGPCGGPRRAPRTCSGSRRAAGNGSRSRSAGRGTGRLLAYRLEVLGDAGAYPALGAYLPNLTALMSSGVYAIPKIETSTVSVVTNTTPTTSLRGAGRPEAAQAIERAIDLFAAEAGLDPAEVRRTNFIAKDAFPYTTATGATYDSGDYEGALDLLLRSAGYEELREEQRRRRADGSARRARDRARRLRRDLEPGRREGVRRGRDHRGRRRHPAHGLPLARPGARDDLRDDRGGAPRAPGGARDSRQEATRTTCPKGTGTFGSKSTQIGGVAGRLAADAVVERATAARGRLPRGERRGRRARPRNRHASTSSTRRSRLSRGRSWRRRRPPTDGSAS